MIDVQKIQTIGIIMDGNRRWAKRRRMSGWRGHEKGYTRLLNVLEWCEEVGLTCLIVYAFSTENWNRTEEEVEHLMRLFRKMIKEFQKDKENFARRGVRVRFIGERERFAPDIQEGMRRVEEETRANNKFTFVVALSYGGRSEIVRAANVLLAEAAAGRIDRMINEEEFSRRLHTRDIPDPDLIIRTGGEMRLSNFLPWQSVYAELAFTDTLWPDFSKKEFLSILKEVAGREQRRGK